MLFSGRISRSKLLAIFLLISLHTIAITNVLAEQRPTTEQGPTVVDLKREGDTFVRAGKFADAGRSYSKALGGSLCGGSVCRRLTFSYSKELDPQSFNLQYLLATTQLQQGKYNQALSSFSKLLELKPDFIQAHFQKAKILEKDGSFEAAKKEVQDFLKGMKGKGEVDSKLAKDREDANDLVSSAVRLELIVDSCVPLTLQLKSLDSAILHLKAARKAISSRSYQKAVDEATKALAVGPNSVELREIRVKGYEGVGDLEGLIGDLRFVL